MKSPKIPMGLAVGLVSGLLKVYKGKNPTFLEKLDFFCFRDIPNFLVAYLEIIYDHHEKKY